MDLADINESYVGGEPLFFHSESPVLKLLSV